MKWEFVQDKYAEYLDGIESATTVYDNRGNPVCYMAPGYDNKEFAKVVANSPAMLDALVSAKAALEAYRDQVHSAETWKGALTEVDAAIAAAVTRDER